MNVRSPGGGGVPNAYTSEQEVSRVISAIARRIKTSDPHMRNALLQRIDDFPESRQTKLIEALKDLTNADNPARILSDGTPFLTAEEESEFDDDIPF